MWPLLGSYKRLRLLKDREHAQYCNYLCFSVQTKKRRGRIWYQWNLKGIKQNKARKKNHHQYVDNSLCIVCVCVCLVKAFYTFTSFYLRFLAVSSPTPRRLCVRFSMIVLNKAATTVPVI